MKQKKLAPFLTISVCLEMILAPLPAFAEKKVSKEEKIQKTIETTKEVVGVTTDIFNAFKGIQPGQQQTPVHLLEAQKALLPDKVFSYGHLSKIPGLGDYLNNSRIDPQRLQCSTMAATLNEVYMESCRLGVSHASGIPEAAQVREMFDYHNSYLQIEKQYHNFSQTSNIDGQKFGIGCMDNAKKILDGFFDYRKNELSKLTASIEAINNQFKETSKADLMAIEDATALLEGGNKRLANKVKTRNPDLLDFSKKFNNPACNSMLAPNSFGKLGSKQGLAGILSELKEEISKPVAGSKYTGESYANAHASVVNDIKNLSEKVATQMDLQFQSIAGDKNGYNSFLAKLQNGISSDNNLSRALTPDLFSDVQMSFNKDKEHLQKLESTLASELRLSPQAIESLYDTKSDTVFETEITAAENRIKNECMARAVSPEEIVRRLHDPNRNKNAANPMAEQLKGIMKDDSISLESKIAKVQELDKKYKSSYYMKMDSSYEVQYLNSEGKLSSKKVSPSTKVTPAIYLADMARNCEAQFKVNKLRAHTGSAAIAKLREVKRGYKDLAQKQRNAIKNQIQKKMIECSDQNVANSSNTGSCTAESFNTSSSSFCAKAAMSCSQNMKQCTQQAEKMVTAIKNDRTIKVNKYKALVEKNKKDIVKIFDAALSRYIREGEMLRAAYGKGFEVPTDIKRDVAEGSNYIDIFKESSNNDGGELLLEDPEKYVKMFQDNVKKLAKEVEEQQNAIKEDIENHIETTKDNYAAVEENAGKKARECLAAYDKAIGDNELAAKAQNDTRQKSMLEVTKFCRQYGIVASNPNPSCDPKVSDLATSVLDAVDTDESREAANNLILACISYNNYKEMNGDEDEEEEYEQQPQLSTNQVCDKDDLSPKVKGYCDNWAKLKTCETKDASTEECTSLAKLYSILELENKIEETYTPRKVASTTRKDFKAQRKEARENIEKRPDLSFCAAQDNSTVSLKAYSDTFLGEKAADDGNPLARRE